MKLNEAVAKRVSEICKQKNITIHRLSLISGVANSTLVDIVKARNESFQIKFIYEICAGLGISLKEFFDSPYFDIDILTD